MGAIAGDQLTEQGEDNSRHGRLGTALSAFQDVTAVLAFTRVFLAGREPFGCPTVGRAFADPELPGAIFVLLGTAGNVDRAEAAIVS